MDGVGGAGAVVAAADDDDDDGTSTVTNVTNVTNINNVTALASLPCEARITVANEVNFYQCGSNWFTRVPGRRRGLRSERPATFAVA